MGVREEAKAMAPARRAVLAVDDGRVSEQRALECLIRLEDGAVSHAAMPRSSRGR